MRDLRTWYAIVAIGELERLERRGWTSTSAERNTAITLAGASLLNLVCLVFAFDLVPSISRPLLWAIVFIVLLILERCHSVAIRRWLRGAVRPNSELKLRARISSLYIWLSLAGATMAALYHIEFR